MWRDLFVCKLISPPSFIALKQPSFLNQIVGIATVASNYNKAKRECDMLIRESRTLTRTKDRCRVVEAGTQGCEGQVGHAGGS
jgi:hypothetical protein